MRPREDRDVGVLLAIWSAIVLVLYTQASGAIDVPWLHFPQAQGTLMLVQEGYKHTNLVALREEVYAVPQGIPFIHPARTALMRENRIFVAHSVQEARRMIDAGTDDIKPKLVMRERHFHGLNLYDLGGRIYAVPAMNPVSATPEPTGQPYWEELVGDTIEEAKRTIETRSVADR